MSSKDQWIDAYETLIEDRIQEFFNKYQRYPNDTEEVIIESQITEDQIRDVLSRLEIKGNDDDGYEF